MVNKEKLIDDFIRNFKQNHFSKEMNNKNNRVCDENILCNPLYKGAH